MKPEMISNFGRFSRHERWEQLYTTNFPYFANFENFLYSPSLPEFLNLPNFQNFLYNKPHKPAISLRISQNNL